MSHPSVWTAPKGRGYYYPEPLMCRCMFMYVNVVLRVVLVSTLSCCRMKIAVQIKFDLMYVGPDNVTRQVYWQPSSTHQSHFLPFPSNDSFLAPTPPPLLCLVPSLGPGSMHLSTPIPIVVALKADRISATLIFPFCFLIQAFDFQTSLETFHGQSYSVSTSL